MSSKARTLDYGKIDPFFGVLGRPRRLAWPVHAYRITIPAARGTGRDLLNPFERVILNVIDAVGSLDERDLAQETCIPEDLVLTVILRLRDKDLINDDNLIIDRNRKSWEEETSEEKYVTALAFRELVGGRLLPFLHIVDDGNPIKTKMADVHKSMPKVNANSHLGPPSAKDVISIVTQMKRRSEAYARSTRTPAIAQIRIEREPEDYHLDCPIAVRTHDSEHRIADPFGVGFSRVLEGAFASCLEKDEALQRWMTGWGQSLSTSKARNGGESRRREPFEADEIRQRYPKLVTALRPPRSAQQRSVDAIYASLEWALYYTCEMHDPERAIRRLQQETASSYPQWLSGIAEGLGFEVPRYGFPPVPHGKFKDYLNQKPEMDTVLSIALLQAEADREHPLRRIASARPDFIGRIRTLASARNARAHGMRVTLSNEVQLESDPFMRECVSALLPAIKFDSNVESPDAESRADRLLDARTGLQDAFGYQSFSKLGPDAKASLLMAEQFCQACEDGDDARAFVSDLYSAVQGVLREFLSGTASTGAPDGDYKEQAGSKAVLAGFGQLPDQLTHVNQKRIREVVLQGYDPSLGASVIVLLLMARDEVLKEIADSQPDFLAIIADIIAKRGHNNQPVPMQRADVGELRKSAIGILSALLELTQGD